MNKFTRITIDPAQMTGLACIRGLRIPVAAVVEMVAEGMTFAEILKAYPDLVEDDIKEALKYAAEALKEREIPLISLNEISGCTGESVTRPEISSISTARTQQAEKNSPQMNADERG